MSAAALTGGIATGKTTVAGLLEASGIPLLDTDAVSSELSGPGGLAIPALRESFGPDCLTQAGALDRPKMRAMVFSDSEARSRLEGILHPLIRARVEDFLLTHRENRCAVAIPLFFETLSYSGRFREVVAVDCSVGLQRERLTRDRKMDSSLVEAILGAQVPRAIRLQLADRVLVNNSGVESLTAQVQSWVREWS